MIDVDKIEREVAKDGRTELLMVLEEVLHHAKEVVRLQTKIEQLLANQKQNPQ